MTQDSSAKGDLRRKLARRPVGRAAGLAGLGLLAVAAAGCFSGGHSDRPVLSVDLYWDENVSPTHFSGGTCQSAGVSWMEWDIRDSGGVIVSQSASSGEDCQNGFDFYDLAPGDYTLTITGHDASDKPLWSSECQGLVLGRFAASYECDIDR
jgi:hypothetical protein